MAQPAGLRFEMRATRRVAPLLSTHLAITAVQWQRYGEVKAFDLVVVSNSKERVQGNIKITAQGVKNGTWLLQDRLSPERWERDGDDLASHGLYVDLPPHAAQIFSFLRA